MYFDNNPFVVHSSPDDRLAFWKTIRQQIAALPDKDALALVAEYWGNAPLDSFSYNPENPVEWPSPWELISRGTVCRNIVAVAMEQILRLSGWDASRLKLIFLRDYDISEELLVLKIDDKYCLNYSVGEVIEYPNTEQIITHVWQYDHKEYVSRPY